MSPSGLFRNTTLLYLILISLFMLAVLIQLGYAVLFFRGLSNTKRESDIPEQSKISVVICARNEARNLQRFLPSVLEQDYPAALFEVVVVNDASTDNSAEVLRAFGRQYSNLTIVTIGTAAPRTLPGKKFALQRGIAAAQHELLLLTDADCKPATGNWINAMNAAAAMPRQSKAGAGIWRLRAPSGPAQPVYPLGNGAYLYAICQLCPRRQNLYGCRPEPAV